MLLLLALVILALALLPAVARAAPGGMLVLSGAGFALAAAALIAGPPGATPPLSGCGSWLALDGLSAVFLLPVFATGMAAGAASLDAGAEARGLPLLLAATAFPLIAGNGFALAGGLAVAMALVWVLGRGSRGVLGPGLAGAFLLVPALALLAPSGLCAGTRAPAVPLDEAGAAIACLLTLAATVLLAWAARAPENAPAGFGAVLAGAVATLAIYPFARIVLGMMGHAPRFWWCVPVLAAGAWIAVAGARRAVLAGDIPGVVAAATRANMGLAITGFGVTLAARASDLPPLAALAFAATLLLVLANGVAMPLLALCGGAVERGAGSRALASLGGLVIGMKRTTLLAVIGAFAVAGLPPGPFFAARWLLTEALIGTTRTGSFGFRVLLVAFMLLVALAAALAFAAMLRLIGVAFLGRPRTPRGAAADDAGTGALAGMGWLALMVLILGLFPGAALRLAAPAIAPIAGTRLGAEAGALALSTATVQPGLYAAPLIAVVLAALALAAWGFATGGPVRRVPAWEDGFAAPPPWLPFGDPATQISAASFAHIVRRVLPKAQRPAVSPPAGLWLARAQRAADRLSARHAHVALAAVLALLLAAASWWRP